MVVDDAVFVRELIKAVLKNENHLCVGEASDGVEALDVMRSTLPDLVILDLVMPKMNGAQACKALREIWPQAKIVACTTMAPEEIAADRDLFDGWISKPFEAREITGMINELFNDKKSVGAPNG